jgi:hypothetical protein
MSETTLPFMFELITMSPDPRNATMRSNFEPSKKITVQVNLPQTKEYIENIEPIVNFQLGVDKEALKEPEPILTPTGLSELYKMLSHPFVPQQEEVSDDEWNDATDGAKEETSDDEGWDETESNDDDDEGWED